MYDPLADKWTWLSGGLPNSAAAASFGERGVASSTNMPPARMYTQMVAAADGKLWIIAGRGNNYQQPLADVWSYDPASGWWTIEAGNEVTVIHSNANYGEFRVPSVTNIMPGRYDFAAGIDQRAGVIYVSGGKSYSNDWVALSDVWSFDISSKIFTWIGGSVAANAAGAYPPVQGLSGGEVHSGRPSIYGGNMWVDPSGGLWLGMGTHYHLQQNVEMICNGEGDDCSLHASQRR